MTWETPNASRSKCSSHRACEDPVSDVDQINHGRAPCSLGLGLRHFFNFSAVVPLHLMATRAGADASVSVSVPVLASPPSREEFERLYVAEKKPVLVQNGVLDGWAALQQWSKGGLADRVKSLGLGSALVSVQVLSSEGKCCGDYGRRVAQEIRMDEFLCQSSHIDHTRSRMSVDMKRDADVKGSSASTGPPRKRLRLTNQASKSVVHTSSSLYLAQCPLRSKNGPAPLSALLQDVATPGFLDAEGLTSVNLWVSTGHTESNLHYDEYDNVLCVIEGHKTVSLFKPSSTYHFHVAPAFAASANHTGLSPSTYTTDALRVCVKPGQALYIPEGWWHHVVSSSSSDTGTCTIGVNFWFHRPLVPSILRPYYIRKLFFKATQQYKERLFGIRLSQALKSQALKGKAPKGKALKGGGGGSFPDEKSIADALVAAKTTKEQLDAVCLSASDPMLMVRALQILKARTRRGDASWANALADWGCVATGILIHFLEQKVEPLLNSDAAHTLYTDMLFESLRGDDKRSYADVETMIKEKMDKFDGIVGFEVLERLLGISAKPCNIGAAESASVGGMGNE